MPRRTDRRRVRPGTPVGSGTAVVGTVPVPRPVHLRRWQRRGRRGGGTRQTRSPTASTHGERQATSIVSTPPRDRNGGKLCRSWHRPLTTCRSSSTATPATTTRSPWSSPPATPNLLGITTVAGNAPLESTTHNAIVVRDLLGIDVPVHSGASRPLIAPPRHAGYVHGESGLDGADLPPPSGPPASRDAVGFIIDTVRNNDGVWLVPTGPLTNIALALRSAPDLAARIAGISFMGGGLFGNRTPTAEFNIWADPEAAAIVVGYGGPLIMTGLDVTHQLQATPERIAEVRDLSGPPRGHACRPDDVLQRHVRQPPRQHARRCRARSRSR